MAKIATFLAYMQRKKVLTYDNIVQIGCKLSYKDQLLKLQQGYYQNNILYLEFVLG